METIKSWYHRIDVQVDRLIRQYKRKKFLLKAKVFLLFVLPVHQETVPNQYVTPEPVGKPVAEDARTK